jgi:hypothetical protein
LFVNVYTGEDYSLLGYDACTLLLCIWRQQVPAELWHPRT